MRRLAVLSLCLSGCFYPADRGRALEAKVDQLSQENARLSTEVRDQLAATLPKVEEKVREVTQALETLDNAARRKDADIGLQVEKTVEDVAALRGQMETYLFKMGELEATLGRLNTETEQRLTESKGPEAVKEAETKRRADVLERPTDKKEFLALADTQAREGERALARQLYGEFLKKWPRDPLTGEAHFGLGETYYADDKCREALFEYGKVLQEFTRSTSAPAAYLRSSECFQKLKMNEEAKLALEELIRSHPRSTQAKTAKTRLAELERAKKPAARKTRK